VIDFENYRGGAVPVPLKNEKTIATSKRLIGQTVTTSINGINGFGYPYPQAFVAFKSENSTTIYIRRMDFIIDVSNFSNSIP
jgi:hypothetical protein